MRTTTHPQKRSRRERALEQRQKELHGWQTGDRDLLRACLPGTSTADKIAFAEREIANLKKKLPNG